MLRIHSHQTMEVYLISGYQMNQFIILHKIEKKCCQYNIHPLAITSNDMYKTQSCLNSPTPSTINAITIIQYYTETHTVFQKQVHFYKGCCETPTVIKKSNVHTCLIMEIHVQTFVTKKGYAKNAYYMTVKGLQYIHIISHDI